MEERKPGLSRDDLDKFLDFAGDRGLIKKKTVENRRRASQTILGILNSAEATDLSKIDLEDVILRHRTLAASSIAPSSLRGIESHVRGSVRDFLEYSKNPTSWKGIKQRVRRAEVSGKKAKGTVAVGESEQAKERTGMRRQPAVHIDLQIHISPDASPEQIDRIFESMSRHFGSQTG